MKKFDIYDPILVPIGPEHESSIIFLMSLGLTEEQAKEKIEKGWKYPIEENIFE